MSDKLTVTLAGKEYPIAPLTIGQMKRSVPAFQRSTLDTVDGVSAMTTMIHLAMCAADPEITPDFIDNLKGVTVAELTAAHRRAAEASGFELIPLPAPVADAPSGEAGPAPEPAPGTATS